MPRLPTSSPRAQQALSIVEALQQRFVTALGAEDFVPIEWLRDEGRHGGGVRFACAETERFNRASVNVSCVHYDDEPQRKLASATALSTIIHPRHPLAPSVHLHVSFTELRDGKGTWRLMADLNPSHRDEADVAAFEAAMRSAAPDEYELARAQGDRYFFIPALGRHRGVTHFYLEEFVTEPAFVQRFAETMLDAYGALFRKERAAPSAEALATQRAYHTLYLFQVLTLDRGTTSGLLVHDQNDLGTMGSLPSVVDRSLLASWEEKVPVPQDELVRSLVAAMPDDRVTDDVRVKLAAIVRAHYRKHPEAVHLQAAPVLSEKSRGH
jgi:coproporphyrinogen III oxidase